MGMQFFLPLYLVFGFLVIVAAWDILGEQKLPQAVVSALMGVPLFLLATFRVAGVGNDDLAYLTMLHEIPSILECSNIYCDYSYTTFNIEFGFFMLLSTLAALARNSYILFGGQFTGGDKFQCQEYSVFLSLLCLGYADLLYAFLSCEGLERDTSGDSLWHSIFSRDVSS